MNIQKKTIVLVLLILLIPSTLFAEYLIKTGYDIYHNFNRMDNPQNDDDLLNGLYTTAYLAGYIDGLAFTQDVIQAMMFPKNRLSENEIQKLSKELNFHRLNLPPKGLPTGQLMLIFKKYAESHPEKLNEPARVCVHKSLIEAYGWE